MFTFSDEEELILVHIEIDYTHGQHETYMQYLDYKIYEKKDWEITKMLNIDNHFGSENEIDYNDIKDKFEIITDQKRIEGFRACFGGGSTNQSGNNIFDEMERHCKETKPKYKDLLRKLTLHVSDMNNLFFLFRDILTALLKTNIFNQNETQEVKNILKDFPEQYYIEDIYSLLFDTYESEIEAKVKVKMQKMMFGGDTIYSRELYNEEMIISGEIDSPLTVCPEEEFETNIELVTYINKELKGYINKELTINDIILARDKLREDKLFIYQAINNLRFEIFKKELLKYLSEPLIKITKRF